MTNINYISVTHPSTSKGYSHCFLHINNQPLDRNSAQCLELNCVVLCALLDYNDIWNKVGAYSMGNMWTN